MQADVDIGSSDRETSCGGPETSASGPDTGAGGHETGGRGPRTGPSDLCRRQRHPALRIVGATTRVVIADSDAARRAGLLDDLTQTMPEVTIFLEAATVAELLQHAAGSRMAILGGPLDEIPTRSLIRMLGQRFPELHVVNMETPGPRTP